MQITKKRLKQIISEEMERLNEMPMGEPMAHDDQFSLVLDFKQVLQKYPSVSPEDAKQALNSALFTAMQESKKRAK